MHLQLTIALGAISERLPCVGDGEITHTKRNSQVLKELRTSSLGEKKKKTNNIYIGIEIKVNMVRRLANLFRRKSRKTNINYPSFIIYYLFETQRSWL